MDRRFYIEFMIVIFVLLFRCSTSSVFFDDDDDDSSWNRCPWIRNKLKNGRVKIRNRGRIAKFLCDPGFELVGKRFATCVRGQWNNPIPMCVARGCSKLPEVANGRVTEMYRGAVILYDCLPGYALEGPPTLYCDGRHWTSAAPACVVAALVPQISCDFEYPDLCGWSQDPTHDFDWKRNQFSTPSGYAGTGPSYDHTFGSGKGGFYLYQEASSPRKPNDVSRLFSPVYTMAQSGGCFFFWYHMFGSDIGGLRVYVKPESHVFGELAPAWELFGDQGNQWRPGNVSVSRFSENFQIVIEGIRGSQYLGDTAIDDVSLTTFSCDSVGPPTESTTVLTSNSCRGRCREAENSTYCGCNDDCHANGNCCYDFMTICTGNYESSENPTDEQARFTEITVTSSSIGSSTESTDISLAVNISNTSQTSTAIPESSTFSVSSSEIQFTAASTSTPVSSSTPAVSPVILNDLSSTTKASTTPIALSTTTSSTRTSSTATPSTTISFPTAPSTTTSSTTITSTSTIATTTTTPIASTSSSTTSSTPAIIVTTPAPATMTPIVITTPSTTTAAATKTTTHIINTIPFIITQPVSSTTVSTTSLETQPLSRSSDTGLSSKSPVSSSTSSSSASSASTFHLTTETLSKEITSTLATSTTLAPTTSTISAPSTSTRRIYNLRPRNRTTLPSTTFTDVPFLFRSYPTRSPTPKSRLVTIRFETIPYSRSSYTSTTTKRPSTMRTNSPTLATTTPFIKNPISTQISNNIPPEPVDDHASKSASTAMDDKQPTVTIVSVIIVIIICFVACGAYIMKRRAVQRQSKLSDDSEMRFLSENEVVEYSDPTALDKMLIH